MASSNARHSRNGVRGVGRLFKWLVAGRPLERKPMVTWASQGGEGRRREQMGLWNEYRAWMPLNRGLSDYWNSHKDCWNLQGCEMGVRVAKWVCIGFSNFAWDFTRQSWFANFSQPLRNFRKVNLGFAKFRKVNFGLWIFLQSLQNEFWNFRKVAKFSQCTFWNFRRVCELCYVFHVFPS